MKALALLSTVELKREYQYLSRLRSGLRRAAKTDLASAKEFYAYGEQMKTIRWILNGRR